MSVENFKYINNVTPEEGTMLLYNQIGSFVDENGNYTYGINGEQFAYEMKYLESRCKTINVRINSIGGSVMDGYSIVSSILNSSCTVNTYVDGLAASTAGWIAVAGAKCYMMDYGTFMMHDPTSMGGDKKYLDIVKDTIVTILSNRTQKTPEEIFSMMKKETWLTAKECKNEGICDEIVSSGKKIKIKKTESLYNIYSIYNQLIQPKKQMKQLNNLLNLGESAEEQEQIVAIESLKAEISDKQKEIETLKSKVDALENDKAETERLAKEKLVAEATAMVEKAIQEGRLEESEKQETVLNASKDAASFKFVSNLLSKAGNTRTSHKPFDFANVKKKNGMKEDRSEWSWSDWSKKDPEGLQKMQKEDSEAFMALYTKEYKKC
jgi:ATP-dependent protease ClpP protease subunit